MVSGGEEEEEEEEVKTLDTLYTYCDDLGEEWVVGFGIRLDTTVRFCSSCAVCGLGIPGQG